MLQKNHFLTYKKKSLHATSLPVQPPGDKHIYRCEGSNDILSFPFNYKKTKPKQKT